MSAPAKPKKVKKADADVKPVALPLDVFTLDERLQHRDDSHGNRALVLPERAEAYAGLLDSGIELPPVRAVRETIDGTEKLWLYGGFHTLRAHFLAKPRRATVQALVYDGNFRDAQLRSFGENVGPAQRTTATVEKVVNELLGDEEWAAWSNEEIARHVGCSGETVRRIRKVQSDLLAERAREERRLAKEQKAREKAERAEARKRGEDVPEPDGEATAEPEAEPERPTTRKVRRGGTTYEMKIDNLGKGRKKAERNGAEPAAVKDCKGKKVPAHLEDVFNTATFSDVIDTMADFIPIVRAAGESNPWLDAAPLLEALETVGTAVKEAAPFAVCPACDGARDGCEHCKGCGFVPESQYDRVAALRPEKPAAESES